MRLRRKAERRHVGCAVQGKTLLLITNSDYQDTDVMMSYCYDRFLPQGMRWRDLFDMVRCGLLAACLCTAYRL